MLQKFNIQQREKNIDQCSSIVTKIESSEKLIVRRDNFCSIFKWTLNQCHGKLRVIAIIASPNVSSHGLLDSNYWSLFSHIALCYAIYEILFFWTPIIGNCVGQLNF